MKLAEIEREEGQQRPGREFYYLDKTPYQILSLPFDIRNQYTDEQLEQIDQVSHWQDGGFAYCQVDRKIVDGDQEKFLIDVWENVITADNQWMKWMFWKRVSQEWDEDPETEG